MAEPNRRLITTMTAEQAEDILNLVHLGMSHKDPDWTDRVVQSQGDMEDLNLINLQIEAFKKVIQVNNLHFTPKAEMGLAFFLDRLGATYLARFIRDKAKFDEKTASAVKG